MSIFEHWEAQKESLRLLIARQQDLTGVVYQVRHALLQTEQNALADLHDDILRQQASVLMSCIKNSIGLLEAHIAAQVWVPQKLNTSHSSKTLWLSAAAMTALLAGFCYWKQLWLGSMLAVAVLILGVIALVSEARSNTLVAQQEETHVTLKPDIDRLFALLDAQLRSADRYLNDFIYLNDQLRGASECTDPAAVSRAADLLEALYECDETERAPADEAARRLLESLGLRALDYSEETSRLFNALPSKNVTRTLAPAIVSVKEQRLLRRGTAAVKTDAA